MSSRATLKTALAVGIKGSFGVLGTLPVDPCTELVVIDRVGRGNPSITLSFDVPHQLAVALLPLVGDRVPCPAMDPLELAFSVDTKGAFGI